MNDIAKQNIKDKLEKALVAEGLLSQDVAKLFGFHPSYISWFKNSKYWVRIPPTLWDKVLCWVNSGQSLKEYSEKKGKVLCEKHEAKSETVNASDIKSDQNVVKVIAQSKKEGLSYKPDVKDRIKPLPKIEPRRLTAGEMVDLLLEEKQSLINKINAIDVLLKHYIS